LIQAQASQFIIQATGMTPDGQPLMLPGQDMGDGTMAPGVDPNLAMEIMQRAYGQEPPQRETFEES
jgi:hypothetical protein